jgi:hypothetical protein
MSDQLFTTNEPQAEEIHELLEIGMLNRVEIDVENPAAYLHATIWSWLKDREDWMPTKDELRRWVEGIIELGIGGSTDE